MNQRNRNSIKAISAPQEPLRRSMPVPGRIPIRSREYVAASTKRGFGNNVTSRESSCASCSSAIFPQRRERLRLESSDIQQSRSAIAASLRVAPEVRCAAMAHSAHWISPAWEIRRVLMGGDSEPGNPRLKLRMRTVHPCQCYPIPAHEYPAGPRLHETVSRQSAKVHGRGQNDPDLLHWILSPPVKN
jgi:hypothetical protein